MDPSLEATEEKFAEAVADGPLTDTNKQINSQPVPP
jgi:hypothetical protein